MNTPLKADSLAVEQPCADELPGDPEFALEDATSTVAQSETSHLSIVCAWCGALQVEGNGTVSHGICPDCAEGLFEDEDDRMT